MTHYSAIDTHKGYLEAVERLSNGTGPIAVDAERASGFRYSQRAYLIQIFRRGAGTFLFDPPAIGGFDELQKVIDNELWILHAANQDLACLREVGLNPTVIFDTELAARLLGFLRVGLASVVKELLGIHLAKEHSAADWSTRPLPESWLTYAALDVELLPNLHEKLAEMLNKAGKNDIATQEFAAVVARETKPIRNEPWRRLSGIHSIKGLHHLAIARELWNARDELAREQDIAPGRLLPDSALVAAATANPSSKRELIKLKNFTGRTSRSEIDRWWDAIDLARHTTALPILQPSKDNLPPTRTWSTKNPGADARLKTARTKITQTSQNLSIPVENLLTPELLRRIAWSPPQPIKTQTIAITLTEYGARKWQVNVLAQIIATAFVEADCVSSANSSDPRE